MSSPFANPCGNLPRRLTEGGGRRLNQWWVVGTPPVLAILLAALGCGKGDASTPARLVPAAGPDTDSRPAEPAEAAALAPPKPDPLVALRPPPVEFIDLRLVLEDACFAIGYHGTGNFTEATLPGYGAPGAWMLPEPASALVRVQAKAKTYGFNLVIFDAYRPARASQAMVAWARRTGQMHLFAEGYIASKSGHNHGHTVDLSLATPDCVPLDMGTPWDTLTQASHTLNARGMALENRLRLKSWMHGEGFVPYHREWWHFGFSVEGTQPRDVPYACGEAEEGGWAPPAGWARVGWVAPILDVQPCPER